MKKPADDSSNSSGSGGTEPAKPSFVYGSSSLGSAPKYAASMFSFGSRAAPAAKVTYSFTSTASDENKDSGLDYHSRIKALNIQVTEWIKKQVDENPLVLLTPGFKDYEKHAKEVKEKYGATPKSTGATGGFQLSSSTTAAPPPATGGFSIASKPGVAWKPFSFNSSSPFSSAAPATAKPEEEEDKPPMLIRVKNADELKSYCFNMKTTLDDVKVKDKISEDDKKTILDKCDETIKWLDVNQLGEKEFGDKLKEIEGICNPIITKMYQAAGGAGMGDIGGAPEGDAGAGSGAGPTIE